MWETWDDEEWATHNHPMFGGVIRSLFTHILGITQKGGCGFENVEIKPKPIKDLTWAKGKITTPHGVISVSYTNENNTICTQFSISDH